MTALLSLSNFRDVASSHCRAAKNRVLLENYYLPGELEARIEAFVAHYNHLRYHESIDNLTPADVYFGRSQTILERNKRKTIHLLNSRSIKSNLMRQTLT